MHNKLKSEKLIKIVFLDRDGVINKKALNDKGYIKTWQEFEFLPGAIAGIKYLKINNFKVFIVSNQRGIALKHMTKKNLESIDKRMQSELKKHDARVDGTYYCIHDYKDNCVCRKPAPGLLHQAAAEYIFDVSKAIFIGDSKTDIEAGKAAGCKAILMKSNTNLFEFITKHSQLFTNFI